MHSSRLGCVDELQVTADLADRLVQTAGDCDLAREVSVEDVAVHGLPKWPGVCSWTPHNAECPGS
jgi:hypothetical protein